MSAIASPHETPASTRSVVLSAAALLFLLIGTHWATFGHMADRWTNDPQYSHGFVVPLFALVVLWSRRDMLKQTTHPTLPALPSARHRAASGNIGGAAGWQ